MASLKRWNGSSWTSVPDGTAVNYWNGSSFVNPNAVKYWNGSSWATAWQKSDPVTYTYNTWFTDNLRHGTSNAWTTSSSNEPHIGAFNGTYPYPYVGVLSIGNSPDGHPAAETAIQTRPVIKEITLKLTRASGVGLNSSVVAGTMNIGILDKAYSASNWSTGTMADLDDDFDFNPNSTENLSGWDYDTSRTISLDPQHGYDMINGDYALIIAGQTSGFTSTATFSGYSASLDYMKFYDHNASTASYKPLFTIKFDYV